MTNKIIQLADENFEDFILKNKDFILVDFWANWCGPCKILHPILLDISELYNSKVIVTQINVDKNPKTTAKYKVRGIPALFLLRQAKVIATKIGSLSKSELITFLNLYV
ncbi:thioredoxin [Buchnera aphidicola (Hormaphis cornu)]|nr:thioredoxin [Buchnera aphidicola (Hormaphis cornu)]